MYLKLHSQEQDCISFQLASLNCNLAWIGMTFRKGLLGSLANAGIPNIIHKMLPLEA